MLGLSAFELARLQFAFTVSFHIIFPAITVGLAGFLVVLEACWLRTQRPVYRDLYHFWLKIFAVNFGMGVVSGLVMAYQFGTNWSGFAAFAGNITGTLLTYEVLTAFFLEAGFLGVMLYGWTRVGPGLHFLSTCMVLLGTLLSSFWILASNSWMQTPAGFVVQAGQAVPTDWLAVIFNPSLPYRFAHMTTAMFLAGAFLVAGTAAWHLLRGRDTPASRTMLSMALGLILVLAPLQLLIGDAHGLNTLKYQPAKIAAIEGHWNNVPGEPSPLLLFGIPDMQTQTTRYALEVPVLGSLILTHSLTRQIPALNTFAPADRPNSTVVFWTFRVMVALGLTMVLAGVWWAVLRRTGGLYRARAYWRFLVLMGPAGLLAILAGWMTTEIGRQPWVVYGVLRTRDAVSSHSPLQMSLSLLAFVGVYCTVFGVGVSYLLRILRILRQGPQPHGENSPPPGGPGTPHTPARPLSAVPPLPLPRRTGQ
jgi:cytochrome d ubiquinol oxidase subunit I